MLIMTLWGVSSTRNASLSLQANYNARMKQLSFEAAEFAANQVGQLLLNEVTSTQIIPVLFNGTNGRYSLVIDKHNLVDFNIPLNGRFDYNNAESWRDESNGMSFLEVEYDNSFVRQPLAIIEYLGRTKKDVEGQPDGLHAFRITAIGWGVDGLASTVIRNHYALNI
jgi:Tfp pilus assembly protein PilX